MAARAFEIFFKSPKSVPVVAHESTKGNRDNAVVVLHKFQPRTKVYSTDHCLCIFGGFLCVSWEFLAREFSAAYADLRYHLAKEQDMVLNVKLEDTLFVQSQILLACGKDFALQYSTDCFAHHANNKFVASLHDIILKQVCMPKRISELAKIGRKTTQYAVRLCANALQRHPKALARVEDLLKQQTIRTNENMSPFFVRIWASTVDALGFKELIVKPMQFRQKQTKYSPKCLQTEENVRLYHPDDFDRIILLVLTHDAWTQSPVQRQSAPSMMQHVWKHMEI